MPLDNPPDIGAFQTQPDLVVNITIDGTGSPSGGMSLRQAVNLADVLGAAETITFDPTVFAQQQTITLTQGQLELSDTDGTQTITGPAAGVTVSGGGISGVFQVDSGVIATVAGLTIADGLFILGAGIDNLGTLTVINSTLSGNVAPGSGADGGGIYNHGTLTVTYSTFSANSAEYGGGIANAGMMTITNSTLSGNSAEYGGGINSAGTITVTNSTLSGNSAEYGGGIVNDNGILTVTDSTLSGNSTSADGGGIDNLNGTLTVTSATVSGNSAAAGGGLYDYDHGTATLNDTIIAGNTAGGSPIDIGGDNANDVTGSYNLVGILGSGGLENEANGNIVLMYPTNLGLAPLGDYGGPTQTMALLPDSPAIRAGNAGPMTTDQRGFVLRSFTSDIGAFQTLATPLLVVTSTGDNGAPSGKLDLRGAVDLADVLDAAETITFDPTVFAQQQTITLTQGQLELSDTAGTQTITGPANGVTVSGGDNSGVFQVDSGVTATIAGLTIADGSSATGAGIDNAGTLTVTDSALSGNTATSYGEGGGGIDNTGTLTVTSSTFSGNAATNGDGGGIDNVGTLTVTSSTFSGNAATNGDGGGIDNVGTLTVTSSTFSGNTSTFGAGGGIYNNTGTLTVASSTLSGNSAEYGGGIDNAGTLRVKGGAIINDNQAYYDGGGIFNTGAMVTITGSSVTGNTAAVVGGGLTVIGGTINISDSTIADNSAGDNGGGIYNSGGAVRISAGSLMANSAAGTRCLRRAPFTTGSAPAPRRGGGTLAIAGATISDNKAFSDGGGIYVYSGSLTITDSTLSSNLAQNLGGGIENAGTLTVTNSTLAGNSSSQFGGGIYNSGTVTVTNSTLSGNSAEYGAGIDNSGTVTVTNSTLSGNSVQDDGGGINNGGAVTLANTIVAGNTNPSGASDLSGSSVSASFNLIGTGGAGGLQNGVDGNIVLTSLAGLGLAPLGSYGGPTQTMALLPGSPAIDAGSNALIPSGHYDRPARICAHRQRRGGHRCLRIAPASPSRSPAEITSRPPSARPSPHRWS